MPQLTKKGDFDETDSYVFLYRIYIMLIIPEKTRELFLENSAGYIRFNSHLFFEEKEHDRRMLLEDPFIQRSILALEEFPSEVLKAHNRPQLGMHRLAMLTDLGLKSYDPGIAEVVSYLLSMLNEQGIPESVIELPSVFGGSGKAEKSWFICDFPLLLYSLRKMGCDSPEINKGFETLLLMADDKGFPCKVKDPKIKGPGPRNSVCPFANLLAARALSIDHRESEAGRSAIRMLLKHWEEGRSKKYFLFGIGTDYRKLKYPLVWYNLLHVLDIVSRYEEFKKDPRVGEMADILESKADSLGLFTSESIYMIYKKEEFSNKKEPSALLSLTCYKVLKRLDRLSFRN